ncbi:MAG: right-handed parallel beta-helix repeat-containing protein [Myxococcota bacterium]|nr:right-handed parallel beta-helix repeat-containing protein [Myxococcota bacterium]
MRFPMTWLCLALCCLFYEGCDDNTSGTEDTPSDTDIDTTSDVETDIGADTNTETSSDADTETTIDTEFDTATGTETDAIDTDSDSQTDIDSDTDTGTGMDTDSEINTDTETETDTETDIDPLGVPQNVMAVAKDSGVDVSWSLVSGAAGYNLYYAEETGVAPDSYQNLIGGTKISDVTSPWPVTPLSNGVRYYFVVTAHDADEESNPSQEVSAMPVLLLPDPEPLYPTFGADWNDYVKSGEDAACEGTEAGIEACLHAGEQRTVPMPLVTCDGVTAEDALGAFHWTCDNSTDPVRIVSIGLKQDQDKSLSNLIDFDSARFRPNRLNVYLNGEPYGATPESDTWWHNPIVINNNGGTLNEQGTIYLVTADAPFDYAVGSNEVGLVIQPGVTLAGASDPEATAVVSDNGYRFFWMEGTIDPTGSERSVHLSSVSFSVLRNLVVKKTNNGDNAEAITLSACKNLKIADVVISESPQTSLRLSSVSDSRFEGIEAVNGGQHGIYATGGARNFWQHIRTASNGGTGFYMSGSSGDTIIDLVSTGNGTGSNHHGVNLTNCSQNLIINTTVANNHGAGFFMVQAAENNTVWNLSSANNGDYGVVVSGTSGGPVYARNNFLANIAAINNGSGNETSGFFGGYMSDNKLYNLAVAHNQGFGIYLKECEQNIFSGQLKLGNNTNLNCNIDPNNDITGIDHITCENNGDSNAQLTIDTSAGDSFVGKVITDDSVNPDDTDGLGTYDEIVDWTGFQTPYRAWGREHADAFPAAGHRLPCTSADTCRIWDWGLTNEDAVLRRTVVGFEDGNSTVVHRWLAADQSACTDIPGASWDEVGSACETVFLMGTMELMDDSAGNENAVCESGEACVATPNIGSYQGHGDLVFTQSIPSGTTELTDIDIYTYETNGY